MLMLISLFTILDVEIMLISIHLMLMLIIDNLGDDLGQKLFQYISC